MQLHLLVALLATTAVLGHLISLPALQLVVWRTFLASLGAAFCVVVFARKRLRLPMRQAATLLGIGGIVGVHWLCFFGSIKVSNISICLAGLATVSFFTAFTEPLLEKRPVRTLEVALGMLVFLGIVVIAGYENGHWAGLGLALLSALLASVFPVLNRRLVNQGNHDPALMVAWEMAGACLTCLLGLLVFEGRTGLENLMKWQRLDWLWLLFLAWVCTVFAHGFHIHLLRKFSAYTVNLALNLEPVYGIAAAAVLFGEHRQLHVGFFIGTATILLANLLHPLVLRRVGRSSRAT
ncbi:DMT family transporter [Luteolibacter yonseiensis]|uniref:DMT family transporter n=1 Tax=Luteolibacter yonseiensis TaxID=1144680 RepID=A0A934RAW5_9BACT|nr:DMT family transporter [Luteolibacter yonseiensis]MBK1818365.1 DMT family transporter [Luteolibacter yonseiensis]